MTKKLGVLCLTAGIIMVLAAGFLLLRGASDDRRAGETARTVLPALQSRIAAGEDAPASADSGQTAITVDGYDYLGYLFIPALGLELPVMDAWDYTRLKTAPCRYYGSVQSNDLIIAGHNYQTHFRRLTECRPGDRVYFTGADGITASYEVVLLEILEPDQVNEMLQGDWDLTLYTCTVGGAHRVTVRCRKTGAVVTPADAA